MLSSTETLWQLVSKNDYPAIINWIKKEPNLVNAIASNTKESLFMLAVSQLAKGSLPLVKFIMDDSCFNHFYRSNQYTSNISTLIESANPKVVALYMQTHPIVTDGKDFSYNIACKCLLKSTISHRKNNEKDPYSQQTQLSAERVKNFKEIVEMIRKASLQKAIETDNVALFDALQPTEPLGDGKLPTEWLTDKTPALSQKYKPAKNTTSMAYNPHAFHSNMATMKALQEKCQALEVSHHAKQTQLVKEAVDNRLGVLDSVLKTFGFK